MHEIRDRREKHWFWIDDAVIDAHAAALGPGALALYVVLVRHANKDGQCYPSMRRLQELLGDISRNTLKKYLALLVSRGLITYETRQDAEGDATSHRYTLLPLPPSPTQETCGESRRTTPLSNFDRGGSNFDRGVGQILTGGGSNFDPKGIGFKEWDLKEEETPFPSLEGEQKNGDPLSREQYTDSIGEHNVCSGDESSMAHMTQAAGHDPIPAQSDLNRVEIRALMSTVWREWGMEALQEGLCDTTPFLEEDGADQPHAPPTDHGPAP